MNGKGKMDWPSGTSYEGQYVNGVKHGQGVLNFSDGRVFRGDFVNGHQHGKGTAISADGKMMRGQWQYGVLFENFDEAAGGPGTAWSRSDSMDDESTMSAQDSASTASLSSRGHDGASCLPFGRTN